ncbi:transmembrane protein 121B, partial [Sebastes umbrosus]|uniref:transmembrane protein 121B n=1 Tax=Sebastes umbrosus TaxID=72105 RepID=UPI00189F95E0
KWERQSEGRLSPILSDLLPSRLPRLLLLSSSRATQQEAGHAKQQQQHPGGEQQQHPASGLPGLLQQQHHPGVEQQQHPASGTRLLQQHPGGEQHPASGTRLLQQHLGGEQHHPASGLHGLQHHLGGEQQQQQQHPGGELQHHPASGLHGLQHHLGGEQQQQHPEPLVPACSIIPEESGCSILHPLVPSSACSSIMTSGELMQSAPLLSHRSKRSVLYKSLCFLLLVFQGGVLDFYLINFTDLYWCSWIATDLVVISGWGIFFAKNARSKRERACGFHQKSSMFGCNLGEFTYAYLAWLIYVIACTPKVVLILETSILDLIELQVPCGVTGFKVIVLLSAPLLFCLINSIIEDLNGATRHRSTSCFLGTCMDLLDSFTLVEMLLRSEIPDPYLKYTVISVHFVVLSVPVIWLYELSASELRCRWLCARFITGLLVNAPLLVVRCFQVYVYRMQVSVFMFKNIFFLACRLLELVEQCAAVRGVRRLNGGRDQAQFSHCVSENDMCPHGYVNTLAVTQS